MTAARGLGVAIVFALGLAGCDNLPGKARARAGEETAPTQIMSFDRLYGRQCAGCHWAQRAR